MKRNITACLVVHNEEKVIERALRSCRDLVDEILVVHDGECQDKTIDICKKYGAKVVVRPHIGEAEPHRVWLLEHAKTPWILQLDADEFLSTELARELPTLIQSRAVACYEFVWPYWKQNRYVTKSWPTKKALYQKDSIRFLGFPHEEVRVHGVTIRSPLVLEHRPNYDNYTFSAFQTKWKKWVDVHARYLLSDYTKLARYPAGDKSLTPHYQEIAIHPLWSALTLPPYHLIGSFVLGGWKEGVNGFIISFMTALYYLRICVRVAQLKGNHE